MPFDSKCADLAAHFLVNASDKETVALAQHIQDAIEEWHHQREWEHEEMERERHDAERQALENHEMEEHFRRHPHG